MIIQVLHLMMLFLIKNKIPNKDIVFDGNKYSVTLN